MSRLKLAPKKAGNQIIDTESDVLEELAEMQNPQVRDKRSLRRLGRKLLPGLKGQFTLVHFPYLGKTVRTVKKDLYRKLRSSRNRNLITDAEQQKLANFTLAIAGMSVGSNVAMATFISGISVEEIRIADGDRLSISNLNRIRAGLPWVKEKKVKIVARQLAELDPFSQIKVFGSLTPANLEKFVSGAKAIVDEVDDLEIKIRLRLAAKAHRIPVVMVTDLEDRALLDVERYDLDADYPLFHGRAGEVTLDTIKDGVSNEMRVRLSTSIVGEENLSERMKSSLQAIGKTLPTWPQLGPAAFMAGTVAAYAIKRICLGKLDSGRWLISLDELIGQS